MNYTKTNTNKFTIVLRIIILTLIILNPLNALAYDKESIQNTYLTKSADGYDITLTSDLFDTLNKYKNNRDIDIFSQQIDKFLQGDMVTILERSIAQNDNQSIGEALGQIINEFTTIINGQGVNDSFGTSITSLINILLSSTGLQILPEEVINSMGPVLNQAVEFVFGEQNTNGLGGGTASSMGDDIAYSITQVMLFMGISRETSENFSNTLGSLIDSLYDFTNSGELNNNIGDDIGSLVDQFLDFIGLSNL